jgi:hypothetical protein
MRLHKHARPVKPADETDRDKICISAPTRTGHQGGNWRESSAPPPLGDNSDRGMTPQQAAEVICYLEAVTRTLGSPEHFQTTIAVFGLSAPRDVLVPNDMQDKRTGDLELPHPSNEGAST